MLMVTLDEIEAAIYKLPESEAGVLAERLQAYVDDRQDHQLESDLESGKLDALISRAEKDIAKNRVRDLDEVLHNT